MKYRDRKGRYLTLEEYAELAGDLNYKVVARSYDLPLGQVVSTVWLGMDHIGGVFETMVFGGPDDQEIMYRYETETEALLGHLRVVLELKSLEPLIPVDFRERV